MTLGLMLLSKDGFYLSKNGKLPTRPTWDKRFLVDMCRDMKVICSLATATTIPNSIHKAAELVTIEPTNEFDINLGVKTFKDHPVDLLIVTRSNSVFKTGKFFNLENYTCILKQGEIELWTLIKKC